MSNRHLKRSFAPVISEDIEVLILGSVPGDRSIAESEYYAHPQNRFWPMIAILLEKPLPQLYSDKKLFLLKNQIGLWDVAREAIRKGSLDSDIRQAVPNDIQLLISQLPKLLHVIFNGKKAEALFDRHFDRQPHINYWSMPSTSPANAGYSMKKLCERWGKVLRQK